MEKKNWKQEAERLFFEEHLSLKEMSETLHITRKYITEHLQTIPGYEEEKQARKERNKEKRKEYQRNWDRNNRDYRTAITADTLKMEHIQAVKVLSHEKYYH